MAEHNEQGEKLQDTLKRTVRHVVETMCFSEVLPSEEPWRNAETIVTAVNFYGTRSGRFELEVSSSAAWSLRDAFLGDSEPNEASASQLVDELGTMICGRFLSAVDPMAKIDLVNPPPAEAPVANVLPKQKIWQGFLLDPGGFSASVQFHPEEN